VERKDGATLRRELHTAQASAPDALGIISWNEFSENSHVEPSLRHGGRYLEVLADVLRARFDFGGDFDSSAPAATSSRFPVPVVAAMLALLVGGILLFRRRSGVHPGGR
jgi:hypothetical protein